MSSPDKDPQGSPTPNFSRLLWPDTKEPKHAVSQSEWEHFPHPKELEYLPDGPQTAYELRQIVKRSLYTYEPQQANACQEKPEVQPHEVQSEDASIPLSIGLSKQRQDSLESADSCKTGRGGSEKDPAAPGGAAALLPSSHLDPRPKSRELKLKPNFLALQMERIGAKLELVSSKRSSRNTEEQQAVATAECASCLDDLPKSDLTLLSCKHSYCKTCFITLITTAMHTESLFPPKCCLTEIPLKTVLYPLDIQQRNSYKLKAAEWAQPTEKRWYCPEPKCAKWIPPSRIHRSQTSSQKCPHCQTRICGMCRGVAHETGTNCPQDFGLHATLDVADREGWRRCYKCKSLVEKTSGCRHMTCTCKAQFCYTCGSKWKTCGCTEMDQVRRDEELRARRRVHDADARREEEIARTIAEVEAAERREAQDRRAAEQREEEERRREIEELRRLEELRVAEEEQRRKDREEAERKIIESSIKERASSLSKMLTELVLIQQAALISRHESMEQDIKTSSEERQTWRRKDYESKKQKLATNIQKRSEILKQKHDTEKYALTTRHEEEEDDMFMQIQMHLRGKPNRETREKALLESLSQLHRNEVAHLNARQTEEEAAFEDAARMEAGALEHSHRAQVEKEKRITDSKFFDLTRQMTAERHWFEAVTGRRRSLLEELRGDLLKTMGGSKLVEEWEALPFPDAVPAVHISKGGSVLVERFTPNQVSSQLPTPPPSPDPAEEIPARFATTKHPSTTSPSSKPQKPTLFISTVVTESHAAGKQSPQLLWETQSHISQSDTASTASWLGLRTPRRMARADKPSRWSFSGGANAKDQVDEETSKTMLRDTVGTVS